MATAAALVATALMPGCASRTGPGAASSSAPSASALLMTPPGVLVLDDGDGAELCLGVAAMSYPPLCGGAAVVGWDWSRWDGAYEEAAGVRWGAFSLTGTYDPETFSFTPVDVRPGAGEGAQPDAAEPVFTTRCDPPEGGWRIVDGSRTTEQSMNAVFERAAALPDYAASWVDRSNLPSAGRDAPPQEQWAETAPQPALTIVNVMVTGDPAAAEAELRRVWGGMLCVTRAERTDAELQAIAGELAASQPQRELLGVHADGMAGTVTVQVIHDDGTLQTALDLAYGPGLVDVVSALQPAG